MAALSANFATRNDRFFLSARSLWFKDIISALKQTNSTIKSRQIGYFQMKFGTFINRYLQSLIPFLDQEIQMNGLNDLNVNYREPMESIL